MQSLAMCLKAKRLTVAFCRPLWMGFLTATGNTQAAGTRLQLPFHDDTTQVLWKLAYLSCVCVAC